MSKNTKVFLFPVVVATVFLLAGCGAGNNNVAEENKNAQGEIKSEESSGGAILNTVEKVKNAMIGGKKLECTYKIKGGEGEEGMSDIKFYSEGKKYKSAYTFNGETTYSISDGETMYSWSEKIKQGTKIAFKCFEEMAKDFPQGEDGNKNQPDLKSSEEAIEGAIGISCQPTGSIDFSLPGDVTFTDTCEQMKKSLEMIQDLSNKFKTNN